MSTPANASPASSSGSQAQPQLPGGATVAVTTPQALPGPTRWSRLLALMGENKKATIGLAIVLVMIIVAIIGPWVAPYSPTQLAVGGPTEHPSSHHWLGTTTTGQDIFSQLLVGTRGSLIVGFVTGFLTTLLAVIVGMTAGYMGGWVDDVLSVITNVALTLPFIPLMIVIASYAAAFNVRGLTVIIVVLTATGWAWGARVKRSQILSLRSKDFVMAAKVSGDSTPRIIFAEILPNMTSLVAASFVFSTVFAVLGEAALEFIGLGDPNVVTWGTMLYYAQTNSGLLQGLWWWFVPPGLCIGFFALGLTLVNYAIDEMTNPRLRVKAVRPRGGVTPTATAATGQGSQPAEGRRDASIA